MTALRTAFHRHTGSKRPFEKHGHHEIRTERRSAATVHFHHVALGSFFRLMAPDNPVMKSVERMKKNRAVPIVLSKEEVERLIGALRNLKHKALVTPLPRTLLRPNRTLPTPLKGQFSQI